MVATATVSLFLTFGAPQMICSSSFSPISTVVILSLSALGCFFKEVIFPTTTPFKDPGIDSYLEIPSTSRPRSVRISDTEL